MNKRPRVASLIVLIVGVTVPVLAEGPTPASASDARRIDVRVFNYARVPSSALMKAQRESKRIFKRSGIELTWLDCAVPNLDGKNSPECTAKTQATDVVLRIVLEDKIVIKHRSEFGVALIPVGSAFGTYANIFYKRIAEYAARWQASEGLLLGHMIAHEIGHLLLGASSHSQSGIMSARWRWQHVEQASRAGLSFTHDESTRMKDQVALRTGWVSAVASGTRLKP